MEDWRREPAKPILDASVGNCFRNLIEVGSLRELRRVEVNRGFREMAAVSGCYAAWHCGIQQPRPSTFGQQIVHCSSTSSALPFSHNEDVARIVSGRNRRKSYGRCSANGSGLSTSCDSVRPENGRAV